MVRVPALLGGWAALYWSIAEDTECDCGNWAFDVGLELGSWDGEVGGRVGGGEGGECGFGSVSGGAVWVGAWDQGFLKYMSVAKQLKFILYHPTRLEQNQKNN